MKTFGKIIRATTSTYMISLVGVLGIVALLEMENEVFTMPFSINVLLIISSLIFLLSKRFAFSTYFSWTLMGIVALVSLVKFREQGFDLHAYDVVFVGGDTSLYSFLLQNYLHLMLPVVVVARVRQNGRCPTLLVLRNASKTTTQFCRDCSIVKDRG